MIRNTFENAGSVTRPRQARLRDTSLKVEDGPSTPDGADVAIEEAYAAEFVPVGDPRPQNKLGLSRAGVSKQCSSNAAT